MTCLGQSEAAPKRFSALNVIADDLMGICAMFPPRPRRVPVCTDAKPAPERFARLRRLSLGVAFCRPCPSPARAALSFRVRVWAFSAMRG